MWASLSELKEITLALQQAIQNNLSVIGENYGTLSVFMVFILWVGILIYLIMQMVDQFIKNEKEINYFLNGMAEYYLEGMLHDKAYRKRILGLMFIPACVGALCGAFAGSAMVGCLLGALISTSIMFSVYEVEHKQKQAEKEE